MEQIQFLAVVILTSLCFVSSRKEFEIQEGQDALNDFIHRYNATKEIDLIFVLDRSGSVPKSGWHSMLNFIDNLLPYFTVDRDNTRLAIITFSTIASVDLNDLEPGWVTDRENKCTVNKRINNYIQNKVTHGYTATYEALNKSYKLLLNSRPTAKKVIFVLTDGKSNIGPPPIKAAYDILSLRWPDWQEDTYGPQVEIYSFGIQNASLPELKSIASDLPKHAFLIPDFQLFQQLARSLHGDLQEENWIVTDHTECSATCQMRGDAICMCGTKIGQYQCVCAEGFELKDGQCKKCPKGFYKEGFSPHLCQRCPSNTTTLTEGSRNSDDCVLDPAYRRCPPLTDVGYGTKFFVTGNSKDEVLNTGVPCDDVSPGNSCHFECEEGFRLTGPPVLVCNSSMQWEGVVPSCQVIDCHELDHDDLDAQNVSFEYINGTTTYGSIIEASCPEGRATVGERIWSCDRYGRWTKPRNFKCWDVICHPLTFGRFMQVHPEDCTTTKQQRGTTCSISCSPGFASAVSSFTCNFDRGSTWLPKQQPLCRDVEPPQIIACPPDIDVEVANWGDTSTVIYYEENEPIITDNSGWYDYFIINRPSNRFEIGQKVIEYQAVDKESNARTCTRRIHVRAKTAEVSFCSGNITLQVDNSKRSKFVHWEEPVFLGPDNTALAYTCTESNDKEFFIGVHTITCYATEHTKAVCQFNIHITEPACVVPYQDQTPNYGSLVCGNNPHIYPKVCRIHCREGYSLRYQYPSDHLFHCNWDGTWNLNEPWPECSRSRRSSHAKETNGIKFFYQGLCEMNKDEIKEAFASAVKKIFDGAQGLCQGRIECDVSNVKVNCGSRSKRSPSSPKRVRNILDLSRNRIKRSVSQEASNQSASIISLTYDMNARIDQSDFNTSEDDQYQLQEILDGLFFAIDDKVAIKNFSIELNDVPHVISDFMNVERFSFLLNCSDGDTVVKSHDDVPMACSPCPIGSYKNKTEDKCILCHQGHYQDEEGRMQCLRCPISTSTKHKGAKNLSECKEFCKAGFFSNYGLEPCEPCQKGSYNPVDGTTVCIQCPENTTTNSSASKLASDCITVSNSTKENVTISGCLEKLCQNGGTCHERSTQGSNPEAFCICQTGFTGSMCEIEEDHCLSEPCLNDGLCESGANGFKCFCTDGFNGSYCEINIDDCLDNPCHYGNCTDRINDYHCACFPGYTGKDCSAAIDYCASSPCLNDAECRNNHGNYHCICPQGFTGVQCEAEFNPCLANPCLNSGTCLVLDNQFECRCPSPYSGHQCQQEISPNFDLVFNSSSVDDYVILRTLPDLYELTICLWIRTTDSRNRGTIFSYAVENNWLSGYNTNILTLYDYGWPQIFINGENRYLKKSLNNGCWHHVSLTWNFMTGDWSYYLNGTLEDEGDDLAKGTFVNGGGHFIIGQDQDVLGGDFNERESFVGEMTQLHIYDQVLTAEAIKKKAASEHCHVGETGNVLAWTQVLNGIKGKLEVRNQSFCLDVNECNFPEAFHCPKQKVCEDMKTSFRCEQCSVGYFGPDCSFARNSCESSPCQNGATCENMLDLEFACHCPIEFTGKLCERRLSPCESYLCQNGGSCVIEDGKAKCVCENDFSGSNCEFHNGKVNSSKCIDNFCKNGGSCVMESNGQVTCACSTGYGGRHCEENLAPCQDIPCQNGGTCMSVNTPNGRSFLCDCPRLFQGRICEIRHEPNCRRSPCLNGGTCRENTTGNGYDCHCPPQDGSNGYGPNCEMLSPCISSPCGLGGTCLHFDNGSYACVCEDDSFKPNCTQNTIPITYTDADTTKREIISQTTPAMATVTTSEVSYCVNVACEHGGVCLEMENGFTCQCAIDYKGIYCQRKRLTETRKYNVVVVLKETFTESLPFNTSFKRTFSNAIHRIYQGIEDGSKVSISIGNIREGSVKVQFTLSHTVFLDGSALGFEAMKDILQNQLLEGSIGNFKATIKGFIFDKEEVSSLPLKNVHRIILFSTIAVLVVVIAFFTAGLAFFLFRKRKEKSGTLKKLNNSPRRIQNHITNRAYESELSETPSGLDDNIYAEVGDNLVPYAVSCKADIQEDLDLSLRFPSKRGKDINKEWNQNPENPMNKFSKDYSNSDLANMNKNINYLKVDIPEKNNTKGSRNLEPQLPPQRKSRADLPSPPYIDMTSDIGQDKKPPPEPVLPPTDSMESIPDMLSTESMEYLVPSSCREDDKANNSPGVMKESYENTGYVEKEPSEYVEPSQEKNPDITEPTYLEMTG